MSMFGRIQGSEGRDLLKRSYLSKKNDTFKTDNELPIKVIHTQTNAQRSQRLSNKMDGRTKSAKEVALRLKKSPHEPDFRIIIGLERC